MNLTIMPEEWEPLIKGYLKRTFYEGTRKNVFAAKPEFTEGDYRFFVKGVAELNAAFTVDRSELPKNYLNRKEHRSGYLLYFLPANALKVRALLHEVDWQKRFEAPTAELSVLDVGCGPGTGLFGTLAFLEDRCARVPGRKDIRLRWMLVDQNRQTLQDAVALHGLLLDALRLKHKDWTIHSEVRTAYGDLEREARRLIGPDRVDLVLGLNLLNELPFASRKTLAQSLLRHAVKDDGFLLLMEPALQGTTRSLMEVRDAIVADQVGSVVSPCLHQAPCPMIRAGNRDWCHTYIPWKRPAWIEKIDQMVGIRKDYLKCAYFILSRRPSVARPEKSLWRVVSGPLNSKGKTERLLCGEEGLPDLLRMVRLDKDYSKTNEDFDRLERGDLVTLPKAGRVERDTVIRRITN